MNRIELENKISEAQRAYYDGHEIMPDAEFDRLWDTLKKEYPESDLLKKIGEDTVKGEKIKHQMIVGSQAKFNTEEGFRKWLESEKIQFPLLVEFKVDGQSCELQYEQGKLKVAVSRGDGYYGENITRAALNIPSIPKTLSENFAGSIRGEIVMNREVFEAKYSKDFKNPRNLSAGLLKNEKFNCYEDLRFVAYDTNHPFIYELEKFMFLVRLGFDVVPTRVFNTPEDVLKYREEVDLSDKEREYNIDGLVLRQNIIDPDDANEVRPKKIHAFKFEHADEERTILKGIEWSMSGETLTPVGIFDEVELEGTTVSRASLANPSLIRELGLKIGDEILVTKRGQIIPKIEEVIEHCGTEEIEFPTVCPICGGPLTLRDNGTRLYCNNEECSSHFAAQLSKYLNVLEVKGFGTEMQKAFIEWGADSLWYLYSESVRNSFNSYYGNINSVKAFADLDKKSKNIPFAKYIAAFNMGNIGIDMAQTLVDAGYTDMDKLGGVITDDLAKIPGWSTIRIKKFVGAFNECYDEMEDMLNAGWITIAKEQEKVSSGISGLRICVTGKLENFSRKSIEEYITSHGGINVSGVTSATDILVTNTPESGTSKNENAKKFGTKILTEEEFISFVEGK